MSLDLIPLICGIWLITTSFIVSTSDFKSKMLFNIVPFFLGVASVGYGLHVMEIITISL